jgi:hypothetical protein
MKSVKIVFGILAGVYTLAQCVYLPSLLIMGAHISTILGSTAGLCLGAAIASVLLKSAFKQKTEE